MMNNTVKKMSEKSVEIIKNNVEKMKKKKEGGGSNSDELEFPNGMRVLVVDDSVVCLRVITALLHKCNYQVTPKQDSAEALILLTQNEDNFDIVLTNVHMHQIDGFKMLEAGLELDIPVIMTSASNDKEIIMKGIKHGARDFLLKPLRKEEIKNIWQHVYRKNLLSSANGREEEQVHSKGSRKMVAKRKAIEGVDEENGRGKYRSERVRWTQPLHDQFVSAVEKLGGVDKAMPKKILELMGSPDITREKVASHLQKYRKAIKKKIELELEGQGIKNRNSNNDDNTIHHHHLHHYHLPSLLLPPPPPQVTFSGGTNLVGSTMAAAASNYPGQSSNLVVGGGYNPHALQVLPNSMVQQSPLQHFDTDDHLYDHSLNNFFDEVYSSLLDDNL